VCVCVCVCVCGFVFCVCACVFLCVCDIPSFRECVGRKMYRIYIFIGR
jgi:hypothetical protein